jgi:ERCC4-type nuclease
LALNFPKLRIIWSKNPEQTASIFKSLKESHANPNLERCEKVGVEINQLEETKGENKS